MGNYAGLTIEGADSFDYAGYNVADAGDFNGDGIADVLVTTGGRYNYTAGEVYVVFGQADGPTTFDLSDIDGTNGIRITPGEAQNLPDIGFPDDVRRLGTFADGVGDINGDGIDDIVIGGRTAIYDYSGPYGRTNGLFVVFGRDTTIPGTTFDSELSLDAIDGTNGFQIDGVTGIVTDVTSAGDMNGDGFGDLMISQTPVPYSDLGGSFPIEVDFTVTDTTATDPKAGSAATEPAIAALDPNGAYAGYLVFGADGLGSSGTVNVNDLDGSNGFGLTVPRSDVQLGSDGGLFGLYGFRLGGMTALGDVNGDGFDDVAMQRSYLDVVVVDDPDGTPNSGDEVTQTLLQNRAFIVFGSNGEGANPAFQAGFDPADGGPNVQEIFWNTVSSSSTFDGSFFGVADNITVAGIGDINGDGFADVAVGNPNINSFSIDNPTIEDSTGRVSIYFGGPQGVDVDVTRDTDGNGESDGLNQDGNQAIGNSDSADLIILKSDGVFDSFGAEIAGVGDVTGDGIDDFLISAAQSDRFFPGPVLTNFEGPGGSATGLPSVFLIFGQDFDSTTPQVIDLDNLDEAAVNATGYRFTSSVFAGFEGQQNNFGESISAAGDVNGDGIGDFIIGSNGATGSSYQGGQSYVVFGGSAALEAADNADGTDDNVIDIANLDVDVETGLLPIEVRIENAGFFSNFQSEGDSGPTVFSFTVVRDGNLSESVSFNFDVAGFGSRAADADDFVGGVLPSGNVTFGDGEATAQVNIAVQGDFVIENSEDFVVSISNATTDGSSPISIVGGESFGRILNDDNPVFFSVSNAFVQEGNDPGDARELVFTVTRFGETDFDASVDISFAPDSFRPADAADLDGGFPATQTISFTAGGPNSQTIALPIAEDVNIEPDERVRATLSNAQSADSPNGVQISDGTGIGTIQNDDFPPRILVEGGGFVTEGTGAGTTTITFQILRQGDTSGATEVTYDLNPLPSPGDFFAADSGDITGSLPEFGTTVRFEDGESVQVVTVDVVRDSIVEPRESFELRITQVESFNGTTYDIFRAARTATILNDDGRPPIIPPGVEADVFGDPHIVTLDGLGYDFQATGEYILVETLDDATNPFQVQVRFEPLDGSDLVSTTTRMAVDVGGVIIEIDANADNPLIIGGVVPSAAELALGAIDVDPIDNGDGTFTPTAPDVFFDAALSEFTIVLNDQNEQLKIKNMDGALNVCVFLADTPTGNQGNVRGLMGDADGTGDTSDDLALRDGTVLLQPVPFDTLYGDFAASWNLNGSSADLTPLFSDGVTVARDPNFPVAVLTVDDLPADLREAAEAAVEAAGIDPDSEPAIFDAAVLDFALTGNPDFISGALGLAAEQTDETAPADAPELPTTVNVSAVDTTITEGDFGSQDVFFTFSRFGVTEGEVTVDFSIGGDIDGSDVSEGVDFTGSVFFEDGETTQTISVEVLGDLLTESDEALTVTIDSAAGADEDDVVLVAGASATTTILTDDFAPDAQDDEFSTDEDTRVSGDVLADNQIEDPADNSDADADGDDLSIVNVTLSNGAVRAANGGLIILPSGAHLRVNSDGTFDYDPFGFTVGLGHQNDTTFDQLNAGEVATETFSYLVTDGNGGSDTATVSINVQGINDAPVAVIDEFIVDEDSSVSGNVIDGPISPDFDPEGGELTVTRINGVLLADADEDLETDGAQITIGDGGILTVFGNGDVSFDTNDAYEGLGDLDGQLVSRLQSAVYTIEDEGGLSDTTSVRFSVRGVNDGPVAVNDEATGDEDTSIFIDVLANDSDVESDELEIIDVANPTNGSVVQDVETGELIYTPDDDFNGTDSFTYVISDGGITSEATVTVTVAPVNDAPEANDDAFVTDEDTAINDNLIFGDIGVATATPDFDVDGDDLTIIAVRDSAGASLQLTNGNTLPEGGQVSIGTDGAFFYDPTFEGGLDRLGAGESELVTLTYVISDGELEAEATVEILVNGVNDAPEAVDQELETDEDVPLSFDPLANASDIDGDDLTVGDITEVVGGAANLVDGVIEFTPDDGFFGAASVTYEITDGIETITTTANITVVEDPNVDPTAVNDADAIGESGDSFLNLLTNDSDANGDALAILEVEGAPSLQEFDIESVGGRTGVGFFVPNAALNFAFATAGAFEDLAQGETDLVVVSYTITDGNGGTSTAEVEITVNGENDAPEAVDQELETDEDVPLSFDPLANASDIDGDDLTVGEITEVVGGAANLVDGVIEFTPDDGFFGAASVTYEITDGIETITTTANITVVEDPNVDPTAVNDADAIGESGDSFLNLLTNDSDANGDALAILEVEGAPSLQEFDIESVGGRTGVGFFVPNAALNFAFATAGAFEDLAQGETDLVVVSYTITDGNGGTSTAEVEITVNGENDAPEAVDQELETDEDVPLSFDPLANASDIDGDDLTVGEITEVVGGAANLVDGVIEFTPDDGFFGAASVTYEITDGIETITTTANITVVEDPNVDPTAVNDADAIGESGDSFLNLLTNDSDANGDALAILEVEGAPSLQEFDIESVGGRTGVGFFVPNAALNFAFATAGAFEDLAQGETDLVVVSYTITDGNGGTSTAEVEITVNGENDGPEIVSDAAFSILENTGTAIGTVEAEDVDTNDTLAFSISGGDDQALFEIDANTGALNFVDAPDFEAPLDLGGTPGDNVYEVEVSVGDGSETFTQEITVTVENDPDDDGGVDRLVIEGTEGHDRLIGTDADELFTSLGGGTDLIVGGGGSDVFEFGDELNNGVREFTFILDFDDDDFLDLNDTGFIEFNIFGRTMLVFEGDGDLALLFNTLDFDETTQLI